MFSFRGVVKIYIYINNIVNCICIHCIHQVFLLNPLQKLELFIMCP